MHRLRVFLLIALSACWLPATSHCALEAAQLVDSDCCFVKQLPASDQDCGMDIGCAWETATLAQSATPLLLKAPCAACLCDLCVLAVVAPVRPVETPVPLGDLEPSWVPEWNFERRTALPVRAPSLAA